LVNTRRAAVLLGRALVANGKVRSLDSSTTEFCDKLIYYQFTHAATSSVDESLRRHRTAAIDVSSGGGGDVSNNSTTNNNKSPSPQPISVMRQVSIASGLLSSELSVSEADERATSDDNKRRDDFDDTETQTELTSPETSETNNTNNDANNNNNNNNNNNDKPKLWDSGRAPVGGGASPLGASDRMQEAALRHIDRLNSSAHHAVAGGISPRVTRRRGRAGSAPSSPDDANNNNNNNNNSGGSPGAQRPPLPLVASPRRSSLTNSARRAASPRSNLQTSSRTPVGAYAFVVVVLRVQRSAV
jgi:hypothetical protein